MDDIDDRGLNGHQFSMSMSNIDVHGSNKPMAGPWGSKSLGGSSTGTGTGVTWMKMKGFGYILCVAMNGLTHSTPSLTLRLILLHLCIVGVLIMQVGGVHCGH